MPTWTLFVWMLAGGITAVTARRFLGGTPPFGQVGDVILGAAGGVVGGMALATTVPGTLGGLLATLVTAVIGAVVLIWVSKLIKTKAKG